MRTGKVAKDNYLFIFLPVILIGTISVSPLSTIKPMSKIALHLLLALTLQGIALGENTHLKLSNLFKSNMVIQRETDAAIWGKAKAGSQVIIKASWEDNTYTASTNKDGKWKTSLKTPKAGGPFTVKVTSEKDEITLNNVMSGEVWICSGQSNMKWKMTASGKNRYRKEIDAANYPNIRFCSIAEALALEEQDDVPAQWQVCSPETVSHFSSVAFFFGEKIHQETNIPIGLISTNWNGSSAEAWISKGVLSNDFPEFNNKLNHYPAIAEKHGANITALTKRPHRLPFNQHSPALIYNGMLKPLMPFSIRGVIWYQGESNVERPAQYTKLFPALIKNWRDQWGIGDFPFYYVQIAPYAYKNKRNIPAAAFLREAQLKALSVPNTAMAVTMDIGEANNIHPVKKKPVGQRLARIALARNYGQASLLDSGPVYTSHLIANNYIKLNFDLGGSTLASPKSGELTHFTIAGKNQKFVPASAIIQGDTIIVSSPEISGPVAVRFAWGNADISNLKNKEGLPASSFRTDNWEIK